MGDPAQRLGPQPQRHRIGGECRVEIAHLLAGDTQIERRLVQRRLGL